MFCGIPWSVGISSSSQRPLTIPLHSPDIRQCLVLGLCKETAKKSTCQKLLFSFAYKLETFTFVNKNWNVSLLSDKCETNLKFVQHNWLLWNHDDVIKWKHFPLYWPFARETTGRRWIPSQRPVAPSFDVSFDLRLYKRMSKQASRRWFETASHSL